MTRYRFALALLLVAGAQAQEDRESPDIRYTVRGEDGYTASVRVAPSGQVTVTQTSPTGKYAPLTGRVDPQQVRVLKSVLRRPEGQAILTDPLPATISGPFKLEFEGYAIEGSRAALGEFAKYQLALEELEGIRDRLIDPGANTVLLDFGAVKRRYLPPLKGAPPAAEISVYMNGDVYLVLPAERTEETAQGGVNAGGGATRSGPHFMTHAERRRLQAAFGDGVGPAGTRQVTPREMRTEFTFEPVRASQPRPSALTSQLVIRLTADRLEGNLKKVSDVLDEIAARIVAMSKADEERDAQREVEPGIAGALGGK